MGEQDSNVYAMVTMVNENVNSARKEILDALDAHEKREMKEITVIKRDIAALQAWKWRGVVAMAVLIALGAVQNVNIQTLVRSLGG